jgi:hypothetical protein
VFKNRDRYKLYQTLRTCLVCNKKYNEHWKVVNHIRKTHDEMHQNFLKKQEDEVFDFFITNNGRVENMVDNLHKSGNVFCGISYARIVDILEKYIYRDEIRKIQRQRISSVMKTIPKTEEHNKRVSEGVKKAWKDGKFHTKEIIEARRKGYENRPSVKGKNNPMYGKPAPKGSGFGKGGFREDIGHYVRSTWEANLSRIYQSVKRSYIYEPTRFEVIVDGEELTYSPDFYFPDRDIYYELKGHAKSAKNWDCTCSTCKKNKKKMVEAVKKYGIKLKLVGNKEYKKIRNKFKTITNWEI